MFVSNRINILIVLVLMFIPYGLNGKIKSYYAWGESAFSPDRANFLYVAEQEDKYVLVKLNLTEATTVSVVSTKSRISNPQFSSDGDLYRLLGESQSQKLHKFDIRTSLSVEFSLEKDVANVHSYSIVSEKLYAFISSGKNNKFLHGRNGAVKFEQPVSEKQSILGVDQDSIYLSQRIAEDFFYFNYSSLPWNGTSETSCTIQSDSDIYNFTMSSKYNRLAWIEDCKIDGTNKIGFSRCLAVITSSPCGSHRSSGLKFGQLVQNLSFGYPFIGLVSNIDKLTGHGKLIIFNTSDGNTKVELNTDLTPLVSD